MPCNAPVCACKGLAVKLTCKHYEPSQHSKYYYCDYFYQYRLSCPIEGSPCATCKYYDKGNVGRPNKTDVDWNNKDEVNAYKRKMRCKQPPNKS